MRINKKYEIVLNSEDIYDIILNSNDLKIIENNEPWKMFKQPTMWTNPQPKSIEYCIDEKFSSLRFNMRSVNNIVIENQEFTLILDLSYNPASKKFSYKPYLKSYSNKNNKQTNRLFATIPVHHDYSTICDIDYQKSSFFRNNDDKEIISYLFMIYLLQKNKHSLYQTFDYTAKNKPWLPSYKSESKDLDILSSIFIDKRKVEFNWNETSINIDELKVYYKDHRFVNRQYNESYNYYYSFEIIDRKWIILLNDNILENTFFSLFIPMYTKTYKNKSRVSSTKYIESKLIFDQDATFNFQKRIKDSLLTLSSISKVPALMEIITYDVY